jgi:hypothetical protein
VATNINQHIAEPAALFNVEGHHVVALIAMADLEVNAPAVKDAVEAILAAAVSHRSIKKAAVFPDEIRDEHPETARFHFINIPLRIGGSTSPALPAAPHVITKIEDFTLVVRDDAGTAEDRADALSWLLHLFGDIHQPMHCVARFNDLHPDGDRGGNSFRLTGDSRNLHSLWDGSVDVARTKSAETIASEAMDANTREELAADLAEPSREAWARASFTIARTFAYTLDEDPGNPPAPSSAYLETMERIARRQVALAGYRLADHFRTLFE